MCAAHRRSDALASPATPLRAPGWRDRWRVWRAARRHGVQVRPGARVVIGRAVVFDVDAGTGASVVLGPGVALGDGCRFHVSGVGTVLIGAGTVLGERCAISAHERVAIGEHCLLADEVVIGDFDHRFEDVERPVRAQGVATAPVVVGDGVRIGPGAALLRGVVVGAGAAVGAHAVVTSDVAPGASVGGVPAGADAAPRRPGGTRR
jgi:acetyltransferase-like isoleucine patch superfamily enzyme